jgi:hypothetical protein
MSLEPKKPIEDLLEATAKARRAQFGADPKIPNPMRAQLHHEIARVVRDDESRRSGNWFRILWPRFAFGTAFALILVSISTLWWWREHQTGSGETMKLAMQEPATESPPPEKVLEQGATAAAAPAAPTFADSNAAASRPAEAGKDADALGRFAESTTAPSTEGLMAGATKSDQPLLADKSLAAKEAKPAAPAAASLAQNRQITNFRQQFSKDAGNQAFRSKLKQTANILNEFQVEQSDHEIRLVDADGSTYSGKLEPLAQSDARSIYNQKKNYGAPLSRAAPIFDEKAQSANAEYYFRATGYNTSLKKSLVFEGNYIAPLAVAQKKVAKAKTESEERDQETSARITGVAKVHGESPVQIDAIAVP